MRNGAYGLSAGAAVGGLLLLGTAAPGADLASTLGTLLLVTAALLAGFGKAIDLLGYVREGATDPSDRDERG